MKKRFFHRRAAAEAEIYKINRKMNYFSLQLALKSPRLRRLCGSFIFC